MQIKILNFGPIKAFDFDLKKDLVMIFGKNNIGKSYGIYVVYLLVKTLLKSQRYVSTNVAVDNDKLQQAFLADFQDAFYATFENIDNITNRFSKKPMSLSLYTNVAELSIEVKDNQLVLTNASLLTKIKNDFPLDTIKQIYYLPAARFGIYQALSAFSAIFAELSKSRNVLRQKVEIPTLTDPVSDYFLGLSNLKINDIKVDKQILSLVEEIEQNIFKGEVIFNPELNKFFYKPSQTDLYLNFSLTSSMVSELFPLVAYLKYIVASEPSLIFIEEPEAHLHPEAQVQLIEILVKLVKVANVKLVVACHSDSIFNKTNNLIIGGKIDIASTNAIVFEEAGEGSLAKALAIDELGIDDDNFLETAQKIYNEKLELVEQLNEAT
ncbi:MAG: AAA family ATPase [Pseudomonadota bacterium]